MRALSATELLRVWERGLNQLPLQRALTLLAAAASPESSSDSLANLSIGQRDAQLLTLREITFGQKFVGLADCPACNEKIELSFDAANIRAQNETETSGELVLRTEGRDVRFRLPTSADLLLVQSREQLLKRCVLSEGNHLEENVAHAIVEEMLSADPMADIQLALSCSSCGHQWQASFDIVAFFWREINVAARSLMRDIHALASAYGWTECEILALSPTRRRAYLEMVNG